MKNKILSFIIGMLVGAILTTIGFFIYEKVNPRNEINIDTNILKEFNNGEGRPEIPNGGQMNNQIMPPEMPFNNRGMTQGNAV